jgi:hypothetical protein
MARAATGSTTEERYRELTTASRALWERALGSLPGGNTRTTIFHDPYPLYLDRGEGCRVIDVDGVQRIDFINNYTSLVLGHCHPRVVEAVQRQAARLISAAAPNELEVEMAERIQERLPSIERIRFTNSGTEATMLAIRAARAFTGRTTIATFTGAYHGTHDYAASIPATGTGARGGLGIPGTVADSIVVAPFNDSETTRAVLEPHFDDLVDFSGGRLERGARVGDGDHRVQREAADQDVDRRQLAEDANRRRIDADLLVRLTQRGIPGGLVRRVDRSPREGDLPLVARERVGADREDEGRVLLADDGDQHRGLARPLLRRTGRGPGR